MKSPLLERLRTATRPLHTELERVTWGDKIMDGTLTSEQYLTLIDWQRRVHETLEPTVADFTTARYRYRPRFPLGSGARSAGAMNGERAIGTLYVLEGASLGGSIIYRKLCANPALSAHAPFPFYREQSEWGLQQWRSYVELLHELQPTDEAIEQAVSGAEDAFRLFAREWRSQSA
ncbi:biliverdin-producing heme oxygenase [Lewinella sp. JB7]|uniref:biliverdin-producing heme oxygenase n=1 Tax=Lewinella sp. JB7 TaxID=2962887 RepID=UPI0020C9F2AB|nr:biliverdin-producing heme oxygenase [Lewinella sp. JB7]MCP9236748.1 biliverdin-producing heme oxygenase [Lewinella sp. JB7]